LLNALMVSNVFCWGGYGIALTLYSLHWGKGVVVGVE